MRELLALESYEFEHPNVFYRTICPPKNVIEHLEEKQIRRFH